MVLQTHLPWATESTSGPTCPWELFISLHYKQGGYKPTCPGQASPQTHFHPWAQGATNSLPWASESTSGPTSTLGAIHLTSLEAGGYKPTCLGQVRAH